MELFHECVDGITTRYWLHRPGIEPWWGRDFPHSSKPTLGPTQPSVQWVSGLPRRGAATGALRSPPTPLYY